jgi:peptidoglycan/xylan/chitin deacetylase (PgdA/CDA1 family)
MLFFFRIRKAVSFFLLSHVYKKKVSLKLKEPLISFTFDDIPRSAIENGEAILKKYNYSGTYYISIGLMEKEGFDFSGNDSALLRKIIDRGGELACHTYKHLHFFQAKKEEIFSDLQQNQASIDNIIPGYKFMNMSFPFGEQTLMAREIIKNKFRSARSVYRGINSGNIDLNCLKSIRLYENNSLRTIFSTIDKAIEKKAWIIFYTHDVMNNPTDIGCSPGYFEEVIRYCHDKKLKVLTINDALDFIQK